MAPNACIVLCNFLAIAFTIAFPIPIQLPGELDLHTNVILPPCSYCIILPSHTQPSTAEPINDRHHGVLVRPHSSEGRRSTDLLSSVHGNVVAFLRRHTHRRTHTTHGQNSQFAAFPNDHLNPTKVRRQNSLPGKLAWGAFQGVVTAGTAMAGDQIAVALTGNDKDHPQRTKKQNEEIAAFEKKKDEEKKERKKKEKEEEKKAEEDKEEEKKVEEEEEKEKKNKEKEDKEKEREQKNEDKEEEKKEEKEKEEEEKHEEKEEKKAKKAEKERDKEEEENTVEDKNGKDTEGKD